MMWVMGVTMSAQWIELLRIWLSKALAVVMAVVLEFSMAYSAVCDLTLSMVRVVVAGMRLWPSSRGNCLCGRLCRLR